MSWLISVHMTGGSMGEAVQPISTAVVSTEEEADRIADTIHDHPASYDGGQLWAIVSELPALQVEEAALAKVMDNYVIKEWDESYDD